MHSFATLVMAGAGMALAAAPGQGAVTASSDAGFVVQSGVDLALTPDAAYALVSAPDRWWISSHSYSGDARNLHIDARAGGCFCETLPDAGGNAGSVEHARVVYAAPGKQLRLVGALGPLQAEAVAGVLTFQFAPADSGSRVTMTYAVGGYMRGGAASIAPMVDQVLAAQLAALKRVADGQGR